MEDIERAQNRRQKHNILVIACGAVSLALMFSVPAIYGHLDAQFCQATANSTTSPVADLMCNLLSSLGVRWASIGLTFGPVFFAMTYAIWFAWQDHTAGWLDFDR